MANLTKTSTAGQNISCIVCVLGLAAAVGSALALTLAAGRWRRRRAMGTQYTVPPNKLEESRREPLLHVHNSGEPARLSPRPSRAVRPLLMRSQDDSDLSSSASRSPSPGLSPRAAPSQQNSPTVMWSSRLDSIGEADVGSIFGLDAGGSLAKLVYFERTGPPLGGRAHATFDDKAGCGGGGGVDHNAPSPSMHRVRSLVALAHGPPSVASALSKFYAFMRACQGVAYVESAVHEGHLSFESPLLGGTLHFLHFATGDLGRVVGLLARQEGSHAAFRGMVRKLGCTGGGSVKYRRQLESELGVLVVAVDEMAALVRGLEFVVGNVVGECYTYRSSTDISPRPEPPASQSIPPRPPPDAAPSLALRSRQRSVTWSQGAAERPSRAPLNLSPPSSTSSAMASSSAARADQPWTEKVPRPGQAVRTDFPYLLVSIGSGVSIIRVDGPNGQHQRVSGSSIGGGTFFGLARYLVEDAEDIGDEDFSHMPVAETPVATPRRRGRRDRKRAKASFDELLALAARGDARRCDMMVGDIYGHDYTRQGLSSDVVASSFGKVKTDRDLNESHQEDARPEDRARALLMMVTNNIAQVAYLNAKQHGAGRIYFIGNFLRRNVVSSQRLSYAIDYWSGGAMEALFLEHEGYFGALGAFILSAHHNG